MNLLKKNFTPHLLLLVLLLCFSKLHAELPHVSKLIQIPTSDYRLVYTSATGTLLDSFDAELDALKAKTKQYSVNALKTVIIFIDIDYPVPTAATRARSNITAGNGPALTDVMRLNKEITPTVLKEMYPPAYLATKRRVLIGVLISPTIKFNDVKGLRSMLLLENQHFGFQVTFRPENLENKASFVAFSRSSIFKLIHVNRDPAVYTLMELTDGVYPTKIFLAYPFSNQTLIDMYTSVENSVLLN